MTMTALEPASVQQLLPLELAGERTAIESFEPEELRHLAILHALVRKTFDPLKVILVVESLFEELGYSAEIHVWLGEDEWEARAMAMTPPEGVQRYRFATSGALEEEDFSGWVDLQPLGYSPQGRCSDLFLKYFCEQVGLVLEHAWIHQKHTKARKNLTNALHTVQEVEAFVGHELRGPLASLGSLAFILEDRLAHVVSEQTPCDDESKSALFEYTQRILTLVNKLSRSTQLLGTLDLDPEALQRDREWIPVMVGPTETVKGAYLADIKSRDLSVVLRTGQRVADSEVFVHRGWFEAILDNLLGNAIKYSAEGGQVEFNIEKSGGMLEIVVSNPVESKVSAANLNRLFDKGYRDSLQEVSSVIGANQGLGLYFVHRIVKMGYNGSTRVWLEEWPSNSHYDHRETHHSEVFGNSSENPSCANLPRMHIEIRIPWSILQA